MNIRWHKFPDEKPQIHKKVVVCNLWGLHLGTMSSDGEFYAENGMRFIPQPTYWHETLSRPTEAE